MNEKVEVQIGTRRLVVEMEGWTPIEINALAQKVSERVVEMQKHNANVADTSKIALLVALSFAAELNRERAGHDTTRRILENKAETMSHSLRESLQAGDDSNG
ncbi:MAG: cell division protein ZapA [Elusimicrobia bacterium]|nr:cell division protein ZapA [Elusimicrobiota bacterium]